MDPKQGNPNSSQFDQVVERLHSANNVLVTVSNNPSADQLAACIGLALALNKLGKHASAVFSGQIPSTIEFLRPEKTIEKNTDSLRDFIIALDKSKADKLRYKVEDQLVKIFITPYRSSITEDDLSFSQGDFNVDAVVALGVQDRDQLDQAILAHGRILHDAAVLSVNTQSGSHLGSVNWIETTASSLCEMASDIAYRLSQGVFDEQIATAFLTGIVAETERFSNQKATPHAMSVSGILMAAGASAQLVTTKLEQAKETPPPPSQQMAEEKPAKNDDGALSIDHSNDPEPPAAFEDTEEPPSPTPPPEPETPDVEGAEFDEHSTDENEDASVPAQPEAPPPPEGRMMHEPPQLGGKLTANSDPESQQYSGITDPLSASEEKTGPILSRKPKKSKKTKKEKTDDNDDKTLEEIERAVDSPHLHQNETEDDKGGDKPPSSPPPPVPPPMMPPS